jgi:hypothetical protein
MLLSNAVTSLAVVRSSTASTTRFLAFIKSLAFHSPSHSHMTS